MEFIKSSYRLLKIIEEVILKFTINIFLNNLDINFIQDDISISKKNVLRGIHGDKKTWKLISCL